MPAIVDGSGSNAANTAVLYASAGVLPAANAALLTNVPVTGALIRAPQILTSGTSYTTPVNCTDIYVELVGGGGGGGGADTSSNAACAAGGGSGAYAAKYFTVTGNTAYTYAIGAGGAGGAANGANATAGTNTTFTVGGTTVTAGGGSGGLGSGSAGEDYFGLPGGLGGTSTNGDINVSGQPGAPAIGYYQQNNSRGALCGGNGGPSFFGGGGRGGSILDSQAVGFDAVSTAGTFGSGGGGAATVSTSGTAGSAGGNGVIRIWEFT